jgi:hypothetical protein
MNWKQNGGCFLPVMNWKQNGGSFLPVMNWKQNGGRRQKEKLLAARKRCLHGTKK